MALAEHLPGVQPPRATFMQSLRVAQTLTPHCVTKCVGVWLGYDDAKPWRARPWVERPAALDPPVVPSSPLSQQQGRRRCVCDRACAACATEAWWADLRCLCTEYLSPSQQHDDGGGGNGGGDGCDGDALMLGMSLPFAPLVEVWDGAVVDRLLHGVRATLSMHAPRWGVAAVEWVSRYALTSLRIALCFRLERRQALQLLPRQLTAAVTTPPVVTPVLPSPPGVAQWKVDYTWDEARQPKLPTPSAGDMASL